MPRILGKPLACVALAIAFLTAPAAAQQDIAERITDLEQQLELLKRQLEAQIAQAQETATKANEQASASAVKFKMKGPTPTFESADGQYSMIFTGRIHYDTALYDQTPVATGAQDQRFRADVNSGTNFRRARIGVEGKIAGDWKYHLMLDAGGDPDTNAGLYEAYLAYNGLQPLTLTLGRHKAATGFAERVSSNDLAFIERSLAHTAPSSNFSPPANGFSAKVNGEQWNVDTGVWYGDSADDARDEFFYWSGRAAYAPINTKDFTIHFGAHASYMFEPEQDTRTSTIFATRPEMRVSDNLWIAAASQTKFANDAAWAYGLEGAAKYQNFWLNGEVNFFGMDQLRDPAGGGLDGPDGNFSSYYIQAGWILTGETKGYKMSKAAWAGVKPKNPFSLSGGGWGALELAIRYSVADLNDNENTFQTDSLGNSEFAGFRGGEEHNVTIGLNWYVNNNIRFMFNYIHADIDRLTVGQSAGQGGLQRGDTFDIYALRAQVKW